MFSVMGLIKKSGGDKWYDVPPHFLKVGGNLSPLSPTCWRPLNGRQFRDSSESLPQLCVAGIHQVRWIGGVNALIVRTSRNFPDDRIVGQWKVCVLNNQ